MKIYERADHDQGAEDFPEPERRRAEGIAETAAGELVSDTGGYLVVPNDHSDTCRDRGDDEYEQAEMHCLLAVISACRFVDALGDGGEINDRVDAESDDAEKDKFDKTSRCVQLSCGTVVLVYGLLRRGLLNGCSAHGTRV